MTTTGEVVSSHSTDRMTDVPSGAYVDAHEDPTTRAMAAIPVTPSQASLVAYDRLTYAFHHEPAFGHGTVESSVDCWHCRQIVAALYPATRDWEADR